jgi:hypothetical protein
VKISQIHENYPYYRQLIVIKFFSKAFPFLSQKLMTNDEINKYLGIIKKLDEWQCFSTDVSSLSLKQCGKCFGNILASSIESHTPLLNTFLKQAPFPKEL